jgi:hypothetical protein
VGHIEGLKLSLKRGSVHSTHFSFAAGPQKTNSLAVKEKPSQENTDGAGTKREVKKVSDQIKLVEKKPGRLEAAASQSREKNL